MFTSHKHIENLNKNITKRKVQIRHKNSLSTIVASIQLKLLHCSSDVHTTTTQTIVMHTEIQVPIISNM